MTQEKGPLKFWTREAADRALSKVVGIETRPGVKWCVKEFSEGRDRPEFLVLGYRKGWIYDRL